MSIPIIVKRLADNIQMRKKTGHRLYHLLLAHQQGTGSSPEGYLALAHLIKAGYFSAIVTISPERMLEEALEGLGYHPPQYETLIVGHDATERIIDALVGECGHTCVIKLYGTDNPQTMSTSAPASSALAALAADLEHYLNNEDIIIVGSIEQEEVLILTLHPQQQGNSTYYVLPYKSSATIEELKITSRREKLPILIPTPYNEFDFFFKALASELVPSFIFDPPKPRLVEADPHTPTRGTFTSPNSSSDTDRLTHASDASKQQKSNSVASAASTESRVVSSLIKKKTRADVLLVTVNDIETRAVLDLCTQHVKPSPGQQTYHDPGLFHCPVLPL